LATSTCTAHSPSELRADQDEPAADKPVMVNRCRRCHLTVARMRLAIVIR
jgi:hypothetical protein